MTRRRAALLAALVALLLTATYLLTRRGHSATEQLELAPTVPDIPAVPPSSRETAQAAAPDVEELDLAAPARPSARRPAEPPRSWGTTRAVPLPTPTPLGEPATAPAEHVEEPLPTWVRVCIVAAALLAFFAVSLIATKQV